MRASLKNEIAERKRAEAALECSQSEQRQLARQLDAEKARLVNSQAVAKVGSWETDLSTLAVIWSQETYRIFETSPDRFHPTNQGFLEFVHPDDRAAVEEAFFRSAGQPGTQAIEHRLLMPDGRVKFVEERWQSFSDDDGRPLRAIGTCQDISDRKRTEEVLRESEDRFRDLFENATDLIQIVSPDGRFLFVNRAWKTTLGYADEDLSNLTIFNIVDEGSKAYCTDAFRRLMNGEDVRAVEAVFVGRQGQRITVEGFVNCRCRNGKPGNARGIFRDVTARRQAEGELRKSEERFRTIFAEAPLGVALIDSFTGHICEVNSRFAEIVGRTRAEMGSIDWMSITHPDEVGEDLDNMALLNARKIPGFNLTKRCRRPDGSYVWINMTVAPLTIDDKSHPQHLCMIEDITERQGTVEALRVSQQVIEGIINAIPVRVFWKDKNLVYLGCNAAFARDAGFGDPKDIIGKDDHQMGWREQADLYRGDDRQILESGLSKLLIEEPQTTPEGNTITLLSSKLPLRNSKGEISGIVGTYMDITERKRAETKLAEASGLLETMLKNSPDAIYFKDRASRFVRVSNAMYGFRGQTGPEMLLGRTDADFFSAEHAQPAYEDEQEIIRTGRPIVDKLEKETFPDGRVTWALTTKMPWRDGTGEIVGTFGISKNVTALKEAEDKLAYERDQLRALLDSSPDTIYFKDAQSRFVLVSRSKVQRALEHVPDLCARRTVRGLPAVVPESELLTGLTDSDTYHDDDARLAYADEQQIVRTGEAIIGKLEKHTFLDRAVRWTLTSKMPWRDREGRIIGTFGISKDITALKETEEKLEQVHRQLLETSRQAGMAEVATSVVHNIGNVLNSVSVSATLAADHVRHSQSANVAKLAALFDEHQSDLAAFLTKDSRGQAIPGYLGTLAESLATEQRTLIAELGHLRKNIEHIKDIVAMQQSHAKASGFIETVPLVEIVEDALRMNASSLERHAVKVVRDFQVRPTISTDKHKVAQTLVNLVRNAELACVESGRADKQVTVRITRDDDRVRVAVIDNGVGIPPENVTRIFNHGFTTRKDGHGFGLHSGALAARELGGSLNVQSDGIGHGATFILELPQNPDTSAHENSVR